MDPQLATAITELAARVEDRLAAVADRVICTYLAEIADYGALDRRILCGDVLPTAERNLRELMSRLASGSNPTDSTLDAIRRSAVRRVHQGISLQALLHAYRLWGQLVWQEFRAVTDHASSGEQQAALEVAGRVMAYVDQLSVAVAQAYLEEVTGVLGDREALRRDLLEGLICGRGDAERMRRRVGSALDLDGQHAVVLARLLEPTGSDRAELRQALTQARRTLTPSRHAILVGIREDEVVAIYSLADAGEYASLVQQSEKWASELSRFAVGVGRMHGAAAGIAASYAEAGEAVRLGTEAGRRGAVTFSDVLLDHLLSSSSHVDALRSETVRPLHDYDRAHDAQLVRTLRAYYAHSFNVARSAEELRVNPNTVVYRLRRIHQLTGHDPRDPDQLLLLVLGMKTDRWARR